MNRRIVRIARANGKAWLRAVRRVVEYYDVPEEYFWHCLRLEPRPMASLVMAGYGARPYVRNAEIKALKEEALREHVS